MIIPYIIAAYVVVTMLKQTSTVSFLGYKLLFIIYTGWCLVYHSLDILALILWIVYGSFIVVMFIFSFLWLDTKHPLRIHYLSPQHLNMLTAIIISLVFVLSLRNACYVSNLVFTVHWINHYELLHLHNSEEIECLGWALSTDNTLPTVLISALLTTACITAIVIIINAKKQKWIILKKTLHLCTDYSRLITTAIRRQIIYQQEARELIKLNLVFFHNHGRRA